MKLKTNLAGLADVYKALDDLGKVAAPEGIRKGLGDATRTLLGSAKAKVPTDTKSLKKALGRVVRKFKVGRGYHGVVGARMDAPPKRGRKAKAARFTHKKAQKGYQKERAVVPANYVHLVEFGTQPHAVSGGAEVGRRGKPTVGQAGKPHPGARPQPFLRPAYDEVKGDVLALIKARVRDEIHALAAKARKPR